MAAIDVFVRGGGVLVLLLIAGLNLRDWGRLTGVRLGACLAAGAAAYLIETAPGFRAATGLWSLPLFILMAGDSVVFWLVALTLFDDGFRLRGWQAALWGALAGTAAVNAFVLGPSHLAVAGQIDQGLNALDLIFAALAVGQALASWRDDLVERRRHVRIAVVIGGAAFIILHATVTASTRGGASSGDLADSVGLLVVAVVIAWGLLGVRSERSRVPSKPALAATPEDSLLLARLERLVTEERLYREPRLSIADLARRMALPEYRLRRLINQGIGARNFAAYVNGFRLAEVKAALADPTQAEVPVLTIALDAGFGSLGPFNRAFRAATGTTPTDYRRGAVASEKTAGRISNSA